MRVLNSLKHTKVEYRTPLKEVPKPATELIDIVYQQALQHHYTIMEMAVACREYEESKVMVALSQLLGKRILILSHLGHLYKR